MRKLIVAEHISLDGVIQAPGGPDEDPSGEFRLGGWTVPYAHDELRLMIYPVVLGRGKHLVGDNAQPSAFTLAHSTSTPGGVLLARYARSGEVRTGTFGEKVNRGAGMTKDGRER